MAKFKVERETVCVSAAPEALVYLTPAGEAYLFARDARRYKERAESFPRLRALNESQDNAWSAQGNLEPAPEPLTWEAPAVVEVRKV